MFKKIILLSAVVFLTTSCDSDSNPISPEEHIDAEGFILESNEIEVYREFEGAIIVNDLNLAVNGTLDLSVHFLDHDGDEIEHEDETGHEEGEDDELSFVISDISIISVEMEEHTDDDDGDEEHHELGFELTGLSIGTTTFTLSLMHDGHADYTSLPISVTVE